MFILPLGIGTIIKMKNKKSFKKSITTQCTVHDAAFIVLIKSQVIIIKLLLFCHRDITSSIVVMEAVV